MTSLTNIVTADCGCSVRTRHHVEVGDAVRCITHGQTEALKVEYPLKPKRQRAETKRDASVHAPDRSGVPRKLIDACGGNLVLAGAVYAVVSDRLTRIRYLETNEIRHQATLEATEQTVNKLCNRLAELTGEAPKTLVDETYKERDLIRRELLGDAGLFADDAD